ncbi:MAG: PAS domain S-box protein [Desulfobulbaceae bacterium]|nr:PAS domain S-box protein [Desulfobulbaceae bacterium]
MKLSDKILSPSAPLNIIQGIALIGVIIFLGEMVSMFIVSILKIGPLLEALIDSSLLLLFIAPAFYFFIYKPFNTQNVLSKAAVHKSKTMANLSKALLAESTIYQVSDIVLDTAKELTQSEFGFVGHIDQDSGALVATTMTKDIWDRCQVPDKDNVFHEFKGLFGWVLNHKKPILTNSPPKDPRSAGTPNGHLPIKRFLSVPALLTDTLVGQIALANSTRDYTEEDLDLLERLADLYAIALKQKFAFDAVKRSEERYKNLFENNPQIMWIYDLETLTFMAINDKAMEYYGYSSDEFFSMTLQDICAPAAIPASEKNPLLAEDIQLRPAGLQQHVKKDGTTVLVDIIAHEIKYRDRACQIVFVNDVTEKRFAEEEMKLFHTLINQSNDSIFVINPDDASLLHVNSKAAAVLGYSTTELSSKKVFEFSANVQSQAEWKNFLENIYENKNLIFETAQKHKSGNLIPLEVNATLITHNQRDYIVAVCRDITERKKAENALAKEKNKLEAVMSALGDGLTMQDKSFRILYQNKIHKDKQGDHRGELCFRAYQGKDHICEGCLLELCFKDGQVHRREANAQTDEGTLYMEVSASPIRDGSGEIIGGIETVRDITERKKLQIQVQQTQKMQALGTLAGGIAHDFNNILTAILGYSEIVQLDLPGESDASHNLEQVIKAGNRAKDLVAQILTFSRQAEQDLKPIQMTQLVKEALKLLRASIPSTIEIKQEIDPRAGMVLADPTQLHQVVMNLCTNAHHAMRDTGGTLTVTLSNIDIAELDEFNKNFDIMPGAYLMLQVSDTGIGMDKKIVERMFEPYFTTKKQGEGTGLGLSVVHGIVSSIGGNIFAQSKLHKGTRFTVFFPRHDQISSEGKTIKEQITGGTESILFVDDEEPIAKLGKQYLERLGYHVLMKTRSVEALEYFLAQPDKFNLVITDMAMPNMSGKELAKKILEIRPDMKIILCTGFSETINREKATQLGITEFVLKPISYNQLAKTVRSVLDE